MKISLSTGSLCFWHPSGDPFELIKLIHEQNLKQNLNIDGIDLSIDVSSSFSFVEDGLCKDILETYEHNVLHVSFSELLIESRRSAEDLKKRLNTVSSLCDFYGIEKTVFHPDFMPGARQDIIVIFLDILSNCSISFELMDPRKQYGGQIEHFIDILSIHPSLGIVPDTAHIQEWQGGYEWQNIFKHPELGDRISMVQMSNSDQSLNHDYYLLNYGKSLETWHLPCVSNMNLYSDDYLSHCRRYPIVLEGAFPPGPVGEALLKKEIDWIRGGNH